jgi:hypothetical protein
MHALQLNLVHRNIDNETLEAFAVAGYLHRPTCSSTHGLLLFAGCSRTLLLVIKRELIDLAVLRRGGVITGKSVSEAKR